MNDTQLAAWVTQHNAIGKSLSKKGANHKQLAIDALRLASRAVNEAQTASYRAQQTLIDGLLEDLRRIAAQETIFTVREVLPLIEKQLGRSS